MIEVNLQNIKSSQIWIGFGTLYSRCPTAAVLCIHVTAEKKILEMREVGLWFQYDWSRSPAQSDFVPYFL